VQSSDVSPGAPARDDGVVFQVGDHALDNGLRILTLEDHSAPVVSFQIHYAVGSRNERPGITGISHLFEHMMFKGTERRGPEMIAREIQAQGGTLNAFTTTDNTSYFENLPADRLELAMDIESDRMLRLRIDEANLRTEREVVRNERKVSLVNTPTGLAEELLLSLLFDAHPYRWPVVGWDADLRAITLQNCLDYFAVHYAPNRATIVLVGDFQTEAAREMACRYFGPAERRPDPPPIVTTERPQRGEKRAIYKKVVQAPGFVAGFHAPAWKDPDWPAVELIETALTAGRSSRLYRRFVKPGRVASISVTGGIYFGTTDPSLVEVAATAPPGGDIAGVEAEVWEEISQIASDGLTGEELAKVRKQREAFFYLQAQSCFSKGVQLGLRQIRQGDWRGMNGQVALWQSVTNADIRRVASALFRPDNRAVVTIQPVTPAEWSDLGTVE
jgi:predicted Zn-dependent peptidase